MTENNSRQRQAQLLSVFRKVHRITGATLFVIFLFVSVTGLLLGWKKHSGGLILPKSHQGVTTDLKDWLPIDSLYRNACRILHDSVSEDLSLVTDRIDIRMDNGMVKFVFTGHYWGIQLDGATGELLHIERRRSDFIENVHDGSILDHCFGTSNGLLKLIYTSTAGLALLVFTITGFWLWYGPKRIKRTRNNG
jgi:uncharacterized iron-regulated membrane protein